MNDQLSKREMQVLKKLWDGLDYEQTAHALRLKRSYIKNLHDRIRLKLNAGNRVQVVRKALEKGWISL